MMKDAAWLATTMHHSSIDGRAGILVLLLLAGAPLAATSADTRMTDPLIGLSFNSALIHFEVWHDSVATRRELGPGLKWVFGCARSKTEEVCIVAGHLMNWSDGGGTGVLEPDFGAVVAHRGQSHQVLGVPDRLFSQKAIVPDAVRARLLRDAVSRYTKAFGGRAALQAAILDQGVTADILPAPLLEALSSSGLQVPVAKSESP